MEVVPISKKALLSHRFVHVFFLAVVLSLCCLNVYELVCVHVSVIWVLETCTLPFVKRPYMDLFYNSNQPVDLFSLSVHRVFCTTNVLGITFKRD